jgi:hypothetical protein
MDRASQVLAQAVPPGVPNSYRPRHHARSIEEKARQTKTTHLQLNQNFALI